MKYLTLLLCVLATSPLYPQLVEVKRDGGTYGGNLATKLQIDVATWEESVFLQPKGPCAVDEIYLYIDGTVAGSLELWIVGDPSEGAIPGTGWVRSFNKLAEPINIEYTGTPGWDTIDIRHLGIRSDGYDRICIQHTISPDGPYFGLDQATSSQGSFVLNPDELLFPNYDIPGKYYVANGNYLVRLGVRYDFPNGTGSLNAPAATFAYKSPTAKLLGSDGKVLKSARVSIADWTGDGYDDVAIGGVFFTNNTDSTFTNVSTSIGIAAAGGGITFGDFNNDGWIDAYGVNGGAGDKIYKNNGDGTFTDVTEAAGITNPYPTVMPIWFDYDLDGWLDLYIANGRTEGTSGEQYFPDQLWHNNGDGTFTNKTDAAGLPSAEPEPYFDCWGATPADYDADGWPDIFVATYRLAPDMLLRNRHDGTFSDEAQATTVLGVETALEGSFGHGVGCDWGDFNNDGLPDLCVGNLSHPDWRGQFSNPSLIYKNNGAGQALSEVHRELGLKFFEMNAGTVWLDLDLDGYLDLWHSQYSYSPTSQDVYRRSRMYINGGPEKNFRLEDKTWHLGPNIHGAWTAVRGDLDHDGDPDLIAASPTDVVKYFRNDVQKNGRWLAIRLKGDPAKKINMDAYGTSVKAYAGGKLIYRDLMGGGSGTTGSQNSNELLFGLGYLTGIDSVVFKWPDGATWTTTALKVNSRYTIGYPDKILNAQESVHGKRIPNAAAYASYGSEKIKLDLIFEEPLSDASLEVIDIVGHVMIRQSHTYLETGTVMLDASGLATGNYIIRIAAPEGELVTKVQVVR